MSKRRSVARGPAGVVLALVAASWVTMAHAAPRQTPSGYEVPRYITLKFAKVNARAGPGDDHKLLFVYRKRGLAVEINTLDQLDRIAARFGNIGQPQTVGRKFPPALHQG